MSFISKKAVCTGLLFFYLLVTTLLFILSGCAGRPWDTTFEEDEAKTNRTMIENQVKKDADCPRTLDSEVAVTWRGPTGSKAFSGYLQLQLPSSVKFVTINPLGQPLFALVSDGQVYSSVNTITRQYISGSLSSLAFRNNIPRGLLTGNWGTWLSGRITAKTGEDIEDVRKDDTGRGIWVVLKAPKGRNKGHEYILYDTTKEQPILRVLTDKGGDPIARIHYLGRQKEGSCRQPTSFTVTGLPLGSEITIHLSDIILNKVFSDNNFIIMPPPGYFIQILP